MTIFLSLINVYMVVIACLAVGAVRDELHRSEVQVHRYAWQLKQLAPDLPATIKIDELAPRP